MKRRPPIRRKLGPYQYRLPLRMPPAEPKVLPSPKAHLVFYDGYWHLFRNRYKSRYRRPPYCAANINGATIPVVQALLAKAHDGWRYGYRSPTRNP